ncbi:hypothetical protein TMatcc_006385 [Talaromyces marneffei ATCC 18224]|uniref:Uncharacterized protein n=1 Tax=Talaromyces marneffei (strain ATCC 18224 / CBS 334.59 / QM 7333) TaxID=441960 RepID=B6QB53_TALMQ|nr:hypothetical protein PMAA_065050 [Talaromyces marneffei ATCC 18224]
MRFYLGPLSAPEHKGQFLLIVPEETLDDYSFTAYWTLDGTPDFYSGTFSDVQFDNVSRFPVKSVHHGEKGSFFFRFNYISETILDGITMELHWDGQSNAVATLEPLEAEDFGGSQGGPESSIYAGILSGYPETDGRLFILTIPWDSADEETASIALFSLSDSAKSPVHPQIEQDSVVFETWQRPQLGKGRFTARSPRWVLEGESRDNDRTALHIWVKPCPTLAAENGSQVEIDTETMSSDPVRLSLISGPSFWFVPIALTLINDSGQTLQYWTARGDPHIAEDMFNLGLDVLSFVAPNWSPSKLVGMVTKGIDVVQKIRDKVKTLVKPFSLEGAKGTVLSSIDFLQRKTGKIGEVELLEHSQRVTFWDFDGTISGTIVMSITWFGFDRETSILTFYTAKREFNKLQSQQVKASDLFDRKRDFKGSERLKRVGKMKSKLPDPWERSEKSIKLAQSDFESNFHGEKLASLTLTKGVGNMDNLSNVPPVWPNGIIYDPVTTDCYKTTFDWKSADVSGDQPVGYLDSNDLLFIQGDDDEYPADDCSQFDTRGTFVKDYFFQSDTGDKEQNEALSFSNKIVFLEYAYIEEGNKNRYNVEKVLFKKVFNPKMPRKPSGQPVDKSEYYDPFMKCIQDGLKEEGKWRKKYWAFWWDPATMYVHGAVYMDRCANEDAGVSPWVIKRKYPSRSDNYPDCSKYPVVAFVCKEHLPINFQSYKDYEGKDE